MSATASPAPSDFERRVREVPYKFCPECSNLLYAKENRQEDRLEFTCKTCQYSEPSEPTCTERKEYGATASATAGTTTDVAADPTVGAPSDESLFFCAMCGEELKCNECGEAALGDPTPVDQEEAVEDTGT